MVGASLEEIYTLLFNAHIRTRTRANILYLYPDKPVK